MGIGTSWSSSSAIVDVHGVGDVQLLLHGTGTSRLSQEPDPISGSRLRAEADPEDQDLPS